ncbi:MAG: hypothetical protein HPY83_11745 [Anaerolineae bacterium]|nr:hypothetical protein [Anaerolineae bacterium]
MELETFLTTFHVVIDDLYKEHVLPKMPSRGGPPARLSDSEAPCLGPAAQWRVGVPWRGERGFVRYACKHLRHPFPGMASQTPFNRRLWGAFILIGQAVAQHAPTEECEMIDCVPVPIARGARSFHPGWLSDIARRGKGGNDGFFHGLRLLLAVSARGLITGWTMASGNVQDRRLAELLLSSRAAMPQLVDPTQAEGMPRLAPPQEWVGPVQSCGTDQERLIVADLGSGGDDWHGRWQDDYGATELTTPECDRRFARRWFSTIRQAIETAFANLCGSFGLHSPQAHTRWELLARVAARMAAYNVGILLNRLSGRPDLAIPTLIC